MHFNEDETQANVFLSEGGYTNDPRDPGGPTNWGITIYDARLYAAEFGWIVGRTVTALDVMAMPKWFAQKVYEAKYWKALRCDELPSGVDYSADDYGVNSGIARSGKVLRRIVGLPDNDWHVTDQVIAELAKRDPNKLIDAINAERLNFLQHLGTWDHFGPGWGRRVSSVRLISHHMALHPVLANAPTPRPAAPDATQGKGIVPPPVIAKTITKVATGAATGTAAVASQTWFSAHPAATAGIVVAGVFVAGAGLAFLEARHKAQQEAPTPGLVPVPLAA